jgi:hypothetical protein
LLCQAHHGFMSFCVRLTCPIPLFRRPAFTAQEEAAATHVPGRDWAKVVVCFVDSEPIQAVIPAPFMVNLDRLLDLTCGSAIRMRWPDFSKSVRPIVGEFAEPPRDHVGEFRLSYRE